MKQFNRITQQLLDLQQADLRLRDELIQKGELHKGYHPAMEQDHNQNADALAKIMDEIGYPTINKVGAAASQAAWLIIQHAISKPDFMRSCAEQLALAVKEQQANPQNLAYLLDRIAIFEGRPQLYGTGFDWDENGELNPQTYDDLSQVNKRRIAIGLNTLEEQITIIRERAIQEKEAPPADFEQRKAEIDQWRRKVGWIK